MLIQLYCICNNQLYQSSVNSTWMNKHNLITFKNLYCWPTEIFHYKSSDIKLIDYFPCASSLQTFSRMLIFLLSKWYLMELKWKAWKDSCLLLLAWEDNLRFATACRVPGGSTIIFHGMPWLYNKRMRGCNYVNASFQQLRTAL